MSENPLNQIWSAICDECKKSVSEVAFNCFLKDLKPVFFNDSEFVVSLNDSYKLEIVEKIYNRAHQLGVPELLLDKYYKILKKQSPADLFLWGENLEDRYAKVMCWLYEWDKYRRVVNDKCLDD